MSFNLEEFGLKKDNLYEIIATTYSITEDKKQIKDIDEAAEILGWTEKGLL